MKGKRNKGFAVINIAILLVTSGLITLGTFLSQNMQNEAINKEKETLRRIHIIKDRLELFLIKERRLPCPALFDLRPGESKAYFAQTFKFGEEVYDNVDQCVNVPGYFRVYKNANLHHFRGAAPVTSLGLAESAMFDGWNNKIEYIVAADLINEDFINVVNKNTIEVKISDINSEKAALIILSHGGDEHGAYNYDGESALSSINADAFELENLDNDTIFDKRAHGTFLHLTDENLKNNINSYCPNCYPEVSNANNNKSICDLTFEGCEQFGRAATWNNAILSNNSNTITMQNGNSYVSLDLSDYNFIKGKTYIISFYLDDMSIDRSRLNFYYYYYRNNSLRTKRLTRFSTTRSADYTSGDIGSTIEIEWKPGTYNNIEAPEKLEFRWSNNRSVFFKISNVKVYPKNEGETGKLKYYIWESISGGEVEDLATDNDYPNSPDRVTDTATGRNNKVPPYPSYGMTNYSSTYGTKSFGYFTPSADGSYNFRIKANDAAILWMTPASTVNDSGIDDGNKMKIASSPSFNVSNWYEGDCSAISNLNNGELPKCNGSDFTLKSGESYYMEVLFVEKYNSDNLSLDMKFNNGAYAPFAGSTLATVPSCLVGLNLSCSNYHEVSATLSAYSAFQSGDVISLNNKMARFIRLEILNSQGSSNYTGINEIRVRKADGTIINPANIKILAHHESLYENDDYANYHPYNLLNDNTITDNNISTYSVAAANQQSGKIWFFDTTKDAPYYVVLDLGDVYSLQDIVIWNMNELGNANSSAKDVQIYLSSNPFFVF